MFSKDGCLSLHNSPHCPHVIVPQFISDNSSVLDVGCNTGYLAIELKKKHCITDGIDINDEAIKIAKKHCNQVFKRDLYKNKLDLPPKKYDYIIFNDILEHLPRPDLILEDTHQYLKKDGTIIVSLPNIARIELRILHLFGKFEYNPGIMSPDHLRFFTKESASKMFENTGYQIKKIVPTGLGHMIKILPELTAFQFVFVATKGKNTKYIK